MKKSQKLPKTLDSSAGKRRNLQLGAALDPLIDAYCERHHVGLAAKTRELWAELLRRPDLAGTVRPACRPLKRPDLA